MREQLAIGLANILIDAKADLSRRNASLEELRTLAANYPNDAAVHELLAWQIRTRRV